jgi:hypothetical protein
MVYLIVFYFFVVTVSLVIINIGYVSYSFSRKYFTVTWPLYVLRNVAKIFVTVLFMPILELFFSLFNCVHESEAVPHRLLATVATNTTSNLYINNISNDIVCFQGSYYVHMLISLIVSILFILICLIVALTFFENSEISDDHMAK